VSRDAAIVWLARRDRAVVAAALAAVVVLAWSYILLGAGVNTGIGEAMMPMPWTVTTVRVMLAMWIAMMAGMMLPSAAPMILLFTAIDRRRTADALGYRATGLFASAYLVVWAAFSVVATGVQWGLEQARLLSPVMATASTALAGVLFLLAGAYQLTPLKQACMRQCRSPLDFLTRCWRTGALGAFGMGLRHGLFCLGCCWAVMVLLFVGGLMNVLWIAALALFVLAEKVVPAGRLLGHAGGVALILWGGVTLLTVIAGSGR
jgi:predicted metal-binding membrane protein